MTSAAEGISWSALPIKRKVKLDIDRRVRIPQEIWTFGEVVRRVGLDK